MRFVYVSGTYLYTVYTESITCQVEEAAEASNSCWPHLARAIAKAMLDACFPSDGCLVVTVSARSTFTLDLSHILEFDFFHFVTKGQHFFSND